MLAPSTSRVLDYETLAFILCDPPARHVGQYYLADLTTTVVRRANPLLCTWLCYQLHTSNGERCASTSEALRLLLVKDKSALIAPVP